MTWSVRAAHPVFAGCFLEVMDGMRSALVQEGVWAQDGAPIVFGGDPEVQGLHPGAILYEAEQPSQMRWWGLEQSRRHVVWTFSEHIANVLRDRGAPRVVTCQVGYDPAMCVAVPSVEPDIDVLFYGSMNNHRAAILQQIRQQGLRLVVHEGFGHDRNRLIARSKVVLNLHYYERAVFEVFRVVPLLVSGVAVVSEWSDVDPGLQDLASVATVHVPAGQIADACARLVGDEAAWKAQRARGLEAIQRTSFRANVRQALADTADLA